jgi:hypothetical protein
MEARFVSVRWVLLLCLMPLAAAAQQTMQLNPQTLIASAVRTELAAASSDHTAFIYRVHDVTPDHDTTSLEVETPQGSLQRKLEDHGRPLTPAERQDDDQRIQKFLHDPAAQAKARKDGAHDDGQAAQLLKLLPEAFDWTFVSENGELVTLSFRPKPGYQPQSMEGRVLGGMAGEVVVDRAEGRIYTIRGKLVADIKFGFGILGKLNQGGTFEVERREVVPHHWQQTDSRVHITGHALFFKTIGDQEDQTNADFKVSPCQTLEQAWAYLQQNAR